MNALIFSNNYELKATVARSCAAHKPGIAVINEMPGMLKIDDGSAIIKPDLIFFHASGEEQESLKALSKLTSKYPQAAVILLATVQAPELLIAAMRMGVREVLGLPLIEAELEKAIVRITGKLRESQRHDGKIISLLSCKGGTGTTFIAANLAHALSFLGQKKTLLIDLNLQFGDAALFLSDAKPATTLSDLCAQIGRLDADLLQSSLLQIAPGFGVLAASSDPDPDDVIRPEQIEAILQLARHHYDFILLDVGRQINGVTLRALDVSDVICPVLQQTLPCLRNGRRMLDMFSTLGYRAEKIKQIANRYDQGSGISISDMESALGQRVSLLVPNNFDIASESINQGTPVLQLARSSNISKAFVELVNTFIDAPLVSSPGIIRRLFVRNHAITQ